MKKLEELKNVSVELSRAEADKFKMYLHQKNINFHSCGCYNNILIQVTMTDAQIAEANKFLNTITK